MIGTKIGHLTVTAELPRENYKAYWECTCICGAKRRLQQSAMLASARAGEDMYCSSTCKSVQQTLAREMGNVYGNMTVIGAEASTDNQGVLAVLRCSCGAISKRRFSRKADWESCTSECAAETKYKNQIGARHSSLTITGVARDHEGQWCFQADCDCGRKTLTLARKVLDGSTHGCGICRHQRVASHPKQIKSAQVVAEAEDLTGREYPAYMVIERTKHFRRARPAWNCRCRYCDSVVEGLRRDDIEAVETNPLVPNGCSSCAKKRAFVGKIAGLVGTTVAGMKLVSFIGTDSGHSEWSCECPGCGGQSQQRMNYLKEAEKKGRNVYCSLSCYHRSTASVDIGKTYGSLTVESLNKDATDANKIVMVNAQCACGDVRVEALTKLRMNKTSACSDRCSAIARRKTQLVGKRFGKVVVTGIGVAAPGEKYENEIVARVACDCGKTHSATPYKLENGLVTSCGCALADYRADFSGENNPNWRDGSTEEVQRARTSQEYFDWRSAVFARDSMTCQCCGHVGPTSGAGMNAHHKYNFSKYKELRYDVDNGITMCRGCHIGFHTDYGNQNNTPEQLSAYLTKYGTFRQKRELRAEGNV